MVNEISGCAKAVVGETFAIKYIFVGHCALSGRFIGGDISKI